MHGRGEIKRRPLAKTWKLTGNYTIRTLIHVNLPENLPDIAENFPRQIGGIDSVFPVTNKYTLDDTMFSSFERSFVLIELPGHYLVQSVYYTGSG